MTTLEQNITFIDKINLAFGRLRKRFISLKSTKEKNQPNTSTFQSLKSINIELWNEILETQNVLLLDKDYFEGKNYTTKDKIELNAKYSELYDDYFAKLNNPFAKNELLETQEKIHLSAKIMLLSDCINSLLSIQRNYKVIQKPLEKEQAVYNCVKTMSKGVNFPKFNTINENIAIIEKLLKSNETTYKRKFGDNEKEEKENRYTFEKQLVDIEQVLGRSINTKDTNVIKWVEYINLATQISKKRQDNGRNKE
jgi:hypothetical protein